MVVIYPKKIEHTTKDSIINNNCCGGRGEGTQVLYDKDNIKNGSATFGSWGETGNRATKCATDYCKCIATPSGTRRRPEKIYATSWDVSLFDSGTIINELQVELSYFTDRYINMSQVPGLFPDKTIISLENAKGKNITSAQKIEGPNGKNTKRYATFSNLNLSLSELKDCKVGIRIGENKRVGVVCKVKIQYVRIDVTKYKDPTPKLSMKSSINQTQTKKNNSYHYTATIKSKNGETGDTVFYVTVPEDTIISNSTPTLKKTSSTPSTITYGHKIKDKDFKNNETTINFDAVSTTLGEKKFNASLSKYSSSKPSSNIKIVEPYVHYDLQAFYCKDDGDWIRIDKNNNGCITSDKDKDGYHFECFTDGDCSGYKIKFKSILYRDMYLTGNENVTITAGDFPLKWLPNSSASVNNFNKNDWQFTNFPVSTTEYESEPILLKDAAKYTIKATHIDTEVPSSNKEITYSIKVKNQPLKKEFFKLRLEDGSDVQYNSLIFTQGDDLEKPLNYDYTDDTEVSDDDFIIIGETAHAPISEAHYVNFKIKLNTEKPIELKNVLARIEAYTIPDDDSDTSISSDDIVIGIDNNGTLKEVNDNKYCLIHSISSEEETNIRLVVFSEYSQTCYIKLRPYNYDLYPPTGNKWKEGKVVFKDYPNIKIGIEGEHDVDVNDIVELKYYIENKSDVEGKELSFHIFEPYGFEPVAYEKDGKSVLYKFTESLSSESPSYNDQRRNIYFPTLEAHSRKYILTKKYQATKKGNFNFSISTVDNANTIVDDQVKNIYKHNILVGAENNLKIQTHVSKNRPYRNELIDFEIRIINGYQDYNKPISFNIKDIGSDEINHENDYEFVYADCEYGVFNDKVEGVIGTWTIEEGIKAHQEYKLTISIKPLETGLHHIRTIMHTGNESQNFTNQVRVLEEKAKLNFDVYHAVNDTDESCDIDKLIRICDIDYINLTDPIYYVIEITNNSRKDIENALHVYGRLPQSFLDNGILCSSPNYTPVVNQTNNLITYTINRLPHCSTVKMAFKLLPSEKGKFVTNFMLSTRSADVLHKKLQLTVDDEFAKRELEHEIKIYNFDKTNKYYRYEIDDNGDMFKFFNTGDKSLRQIESESYDINAVEVYRGSNLKSIVQDIKNNSKYVDPVLLREGSNKLKDKGYELYPDGLIRRFGLLKSEVFHYAHQLPNVSNLAKYAMRWDVDEWDTKVWAGGNYVNGVFDLSIDYGKVPSNFNILDVENPIKNLQALVDNTKPYGTKALCYYANTVDVDFGFKINSVDAQTESIHHLDLNFDDIYVLSVFNRHDGNTYYINDDISADIDLNIDTAIAEYPYHRNYYRNNPTEKTSEHYPYHKDYKKNSFDFNDALKYKYLSNRTPPAIKNDDIELGKYSIAPITTSVYSKDNEISKTYIKECLDIIENLYYTNDTNGIDITKPFMTPEIIDSPTSYLSDMQFLNCVNNCSDKQTIGYKITYKGYEVIMGYHKDEINNFEGFIIKENNNITHKRQNNQQADNFSIQIQTINIGTNDKIIHLWGSINEDKYYHIGFIRLSDIPKDENSNQSSPELAFYTSEANNKCSAQYGTVSAEYDEKITFQVSNKINEQAIKHSYIESGKEWRKLNKINNGGYAEIFYDAKDECTENLKTNIPKLILKYDNFNIADDDEIVDIAFKIKAKSNNDNIINNININMFRDGDSILPVDNIGRKIYYPSRIENEKQQLMTNIIIKEPNITICSDCLKTSLGFFDQCPHCNSRKVSHQKETTPVTVCDHCGWVIKGTHDYCKHCLSLNVFNVDADYNKTYCNNCKTLSDDYYHRCPKCFSADVIYIDNKITSYKIYDEDTQNIKPITIQTNQKEANIFNATIPLNQDTSILNDINFLTLNIKGTNNTETKYYYCEECGVGGIGNVKKCPVCGSKHVHNNQIDLSHFKVYMDINTYTQKSTSSVDCIGDNYMPNGEFVKTIDLAKCIKANTSDSFDLSFYIDNQAYEDNISKILDLPISDKYQDAIISKINIFDFTIDNIYIDYKFTNENNWIGLDNLENADHSYIKYEIPEHENTSETLIFSNFGAPKNTYNSATLHISGLCKNNKNTFSAVIELIDTHGNKYNTEVNNINNDLFNIDVDLTNSALVGNNIDNLTAKIYFKEVDSTEEILISNCYIETEYTKYDKSTNTNLQPIPTQIVSDKNKKYLIKSNNDLWGINQYKPYYLQGSHLSTGLLCYIDFGQLKNGDYLRVYDIEAILYYKKKSGKIITDTVIIMNSDTETNVNNYEQHICGSIDKNKGDIWGFIDTAQLSLSNLEYEKLIINDNGELFNSIPLRNKILQSFTLDTSNIEDISRLYINYAGQNGYPGEYITVSLYDDKNKAPNNLIYKTKIKMPTNQSLQTLNVDFNIDNIKQQTKYWIVIEDNNADEYNYYKFKFNNNTGTNNNTIEYGTMTTSYHELIYDNRLDTTKTLSFGFDSPLHEYNYYNLPFMCEVEKDDIDSNYSPEGEIQGYISIKENIVKFTTEKDESENYNTVAINNDIEKQYKIKNILYRYNVQDDTNVYLNDFIIKNGYKIILSDDDE